MPHCCMVAILGKTSFVMATNIYFIYQATGVQTPGTTGALRIGAEFLHRWYNINTEISVCIAHLAYGKFHS